MLVFVVLKKGVARIMKIDEFVSRCNGRFNRLDIQSVVDTAFFASHGIIGFESNGDIAIAYEDNIIFGYETLDHKTDTGEVLFYRDGSELVGRISYIKDEGAMIYVNDQLVGDYFTNRNEATVMLTQRLLNFSI